MKIQQAETFSPITITLETEDEAAALTALLGGTVDGGVANGTIYQMYDNLDVVVDWRKKYTYEGQIRLKDA
jgi:hypothetical protein